MAKNKTIAQQRIPLPGRDYELCLPGDGKLSVGEMNTWFTCQEQYRRTYVQNERSIGSPQQMVGQAHHVVMEYNNHRKRRGKKSITVKAADELFTDSLATLAGNQKNGKPEYEYDQETVDAGTKQAMGFYEQYFFSVDPKIEPLLVEDTFNCEIAGVPITGRVDVVEETCLDDYKVLGKAMSAKHYILQQQVYTHAYSLPIFKFIVFNKALGSVQVVQRRNTLKKVEKWLGYQVSRVAYQISLAMQTGVFHPVNPDVTWKCSPKWCQFYKQCYGQHT